MLSILYPDQHIQVNFDLYHVHTGFTYKSILLRLAHSTLKQNVNKKKQQQKIKTI